MYGSKQQYRPKRKVKLTYHIREDSSWERHTGAVTALQLDERRGVLYTAGRDGTVREWSVGAAGEAPVATRTLEGHTDWVNDVVLCRLGEHTRVASVSADRTVKLWDVDSRGADAAALGHAAAETLAQHSDYVKAAAFAEDSRTLMTAGLDGKVWAWNLGASPAKEVGPAWEHPQSIYSVGVDRSGTMAVLGTVDKVVRLWDPRDSSSRGTLKGHQDIVKAVAVSHDGRRCLSAGSDKMIKLWDVGERRCITTFRPHADSIWCLDVDADFTRVYSGGRDGAVFVTDLARVDGRPSAAAAADDQPASIKLTDTQSPLLAITITADEAGLWTSSLRDGVREHSVDASFQAASQRALEVEPPLTRVELFADGLTACTQDAAGRVKLWNLPTASLAEDVGETPFADVVAARNIELCHVAKWCSLDTALGFLSVHLEPNNAFAAWIHDRHLNDKNSGGVVNIGGFVLRALLRRFQDVVGSERRGSPVAPRGVGEGAAAADAAAEEAVLAKAHEYYLERKLSHDDFTIPGRTRVVVTQATEPVQTLCLTTVGTAGETARALDRACPEWIQNCLFNADSAFGLKGKSTCPVVTVTMNPRKDVPSELKLPSLGKRFTSGADKFNAPLVVQMSSFKVALVDQLKTYGCDTVEADGIALFLNGKEVDDAAEISYVATVLCGGKDVMIEYSRSTTPKAGA